MHGILMVLFYMTVIIVMNLAGVRQDMGLTQLMVTALIGVAIGAGDVWVRANKG